MKIGFILGDWSRNIGNAFFQLGGLYVLKHIFPDAEIAIIAEQPGYPSYWNPHGGNPKNYLRMASLIDMDYLVLMGPLFRPETDKIWGAELGEILSNGTRLILLGVAAMSYEESNKEGYRKFLEKYPPFLLTSRDRDSYNLFGEYAIHAYDGIDFGFFLPEVYKPVGFRNRAKPFIAMNFDKMPEPTIKVVDEVDSNENKAYDYAFIFNNKKWLLKFPGLRTKFALISRYAMFLEGILGNGSQVDCIDGFAVIRTDHRPHPLLGKKTFRYPNTMVNDTPYPYLEIYSQAELTLSSRLHACVAALSYGKNAMLFSTSSRSRLFDRLELGNINISPTKIDMQKLAMEKKYLLEFIQDHLTRLK